MRPSGCSRCFPKIQATMRAWVRETVGALKANLIYLCPACAKKMCEAKRLIAIDERANTIPANPLQVEL